MTFHIVQRGNNKNDTFYEERDYRFYLHLLGLFSKRTGTRVHAYVLMTNHIHLLMTSDQTDGISKTIQLVSSSYSQWVNKRYERTGSLWEGRFKSSPVDSEYYCLACYRYIELNPVRAGMVSSPADYPWSSYLQNAERGPFDCVIPHPCYEALARSAHERRRRYRQLFGDALPRRTLARFRHASRKGLPVGSDAFLKAVETAIGTSVGTRCIGRPRTRRTEKDKGV